MSLLGLNADSQENNMDTQEPTPSIAMEEGKKESEKTDDMSQGGVEADLQEQEAAKSETMNQDQEMTETESQQRDGETSVTELSPSSVFVDNLCGPFKYLQILASLEYGYSLYSVYFC